MALQLFVGLCFKGSIFKDKPYLLPGDLMKKSKISKTYHLTARTEFVFLNKFPVRIFFVLLLLNNRWFVHIYALIPSLRFHIVPVYPLYYKF